jgi:hypothetical protein
VAERQKSAPKKVNWRLAAPDFSAAYVVKIFNALELCKH